MSDAHTGVQDLPGIGTAACLLQTPNSFSKQVVVSDGPFADEGEADIDPILFEFSGTSEVAFEKQVSGMALATGS